MTLFKQTLLIGLLFAFQPALAETVTTTAEDGTTVYGETYYGDLDETAPMIALFHQAGANGRGEYAPLAGWLNAEGFRAIAWDQRSGGDRFGGENRTLKTFCKKPGYCEAYPDLEAGLAFTAQAADGAPVAVWGSSYSAALVFRLAADHAESIDAVVAASPASGEPLAACSLEEVLDDVTTPVLALRPRSEVEATKAQAELLKAAGVDFYIVEDGVHGSSMFVDERTKHDMASARDFVADWLRQHLKAEE